MSEIKIVNAVQKQILRGRILSLCKEAQPIGAGLEVLTAILKKQGFSVEKHEVSEDCGYLSGKGLIRIEHVENSVLGISRSIAHIMPEGIDALEGTKEIAGVILGG